MLASKLRHASPFALGFITLCLEREAVRAHIDRHPLADCDLCAGVWGYGPGEWAARNHPELRHPSHHFVLHGFSHTRGGPLGVVYATIGPMGFPAPPVSR